MGDWIDRLAVGMSLLASCGYALWSLGPKGWRRRGLSGALALLGCLPQVFGLRRLKQRLEAAAQGGTSGGCGGCGSCAPPSGAGAETRIPLSKIGRR